MQNLQLTAHPALGGEADGCPAAWLGWPEGWRSSRRDSGGSGKKFFRVFNAIAVWHPDGLDGLTIGEADEVADGSIDGEESLVDGRKPDAVSF